MNVKATLTTITVVTALVFVIGCGSSDSASDVNRTSGATRTLSPEPASTNTPVPATPTPTPTRQPFDPGSLAPTPENESLDPAVYDLIGLGPVKSLPVALLPDSQPLAPEEVELLWESFLSGTRLQTTVEAVGGPREGHFNVDFLLCDGNVGRRLWADRVADVEWSVDHSPAGAWNSVNLITRVTLGQRDEVNEDKQDALTISEAGVHYRSLDRPMDITELLECPA